MKQVIIDLDEATLELLEQVAPSRERKRSAFVRTAIRRALDELAQQRIADGYRRIPDSSDASYSVPEQWEAIPARRSKKVSR